jgi:23S rRNA pseudouridine2605 synthase
MVKNDIKKIMKKNLKKEALNKSKKKFNKVIKKDEIEEKGERINKFISHNTKYSRREADKLIADGKVNVNNKIVTEPSTQIFESDKVLVNGKFIKRMENLFTVLVYNKPKGELVTKVDDRGRKTIYHSLPTRFRHFIPIGRLDFASEGVLLLSDNPKIATILMQSDLERVYNIKIDGIVTKEMEIAMKDGFTIKGTAGAHEKTKIDTMVIAPFFAYQILKNRPEYSRLKVAITEGKNRELRRFFGHFDREVVDLKRVSFGGIDLNNLPTGKHRFLTKKEYDNLKEFIFGGKKKENKPS